MLALISPAKKLDFESDTLSDQFTQPDFLDHSQELIDTARKMSRPQIQSLMKLSDKLTELNFNRYQNYSAPFSLGNAKQAAYAFKGDTYVGLQADTLNNDDLNFAQDHLRILSGLYGLLRPLDLMQAYRLEMGTKLSNPRGEDLYDFWGELLTKSCNDVIAGHKGKAIINLASNEYIKAVRPKELDGLFITPQFKEVKEGIPKMIGLFAKRARGTMARHIIQNRIEDPELLKNFTEDGYAYAPELSTETEWVFLRDQS